jgi:hypothetical protein
MSQQDASKVCATCGRRFYYHARWGDNWPQVKHCSKRCASQKPGKPEAELEALLLERVEQLKTGTTLCPSEVARAFAPDTWRQWMEPTRQAARRLAGAGKLCIKQKGKTIDPHEFRGPIRLGKH